MDLLSIYKSSLSLLTDFYELTMAYGYWKTGTHNKEAVFHHFFRKKPFKGSYAITCGLQALVEFIENFKFSKCDLDYLSSLRTHTGNLFFEENFLSYLEDLKLQVDIDAIKEGTPIFSYEPMVRVQGPILHCQLLETPLLNLINFPTLIATKARRVKYAAAQDYVLEFGVRRAQGIDGSITATRASFIGGVDATSNVIAGKLFNIPVKGTHAHSWVMSFDSELQSFEAWQNVYPDNSVLLVDTYGTLEGINNAIKAGLVLKQRGKDLKGIRLDSGDLVNLSIKARDLLDKAGFLKTEIYASNELDEYRIQKLKNDGAKITVWGVGTRLVTGDPQGALDGVYKLSGLKDSKDNWQFKMKISEKCEKISLPGFLQIKRLFDKGIYCQDIVYCQNHPIKSEGEDLLVPIFRKGQCVYKLPTLQEIRDYSMKEFDKFSDLIKVFENPNEYLVTSDLYLKKLRKDLGEV